MQERVIYPPLAAHSSLRQPLTLGEKKVFELFRKQLPPKWEIYIQPHLNGLRPDFVLLNPNSGIAVFEVKDWSLSAMRYFTREDQWGHPSLWAEKDGKSFSIQKDNPISKVARYKKEIFELYCPRLQKGNGWAAITAGVIFPFAEVSEVTTLLSPFIPSDSYPEYRPISGKNELSSEDIQSIFPDGGRASSSVMSENHAKDLRGWLVEPDFASTQRTPLVLDSKQRDIVESDPGKTGYRRIKGPAGSGKSIVLAARVARLASEGKTVLIATFNITLWHYLRDLIVRDLAAPGHIKNIQFTHFHHWCKQVCYEVGWKERYHAVWNGYDETKPETREKILNMDLPRLADEAIQQPNAQLFDAILIDEAQDYLPNWWKVLRKAHKPNGEVLFVADATQDIYATARAWTDDVMTGAGFVGQPRKLEVSYRLPPKALSIVRSFADNLLPKDTVDLPEPEQGSLDLYPSSLRWVQCSRESAADVCLNEVNSLMHKTGKRGLANADITLLSSDKNSGLKIVRWLKGNWIETVHTFEQDDRRQKMAFYMGDARIKATTVHSFKGWESRLLIIYITEATDTKSLALIYTGLTRLKRSPHGSWLTVVNSAPQLSSIGQQFDEFESIS